MSRRVLLYARVNPADEGGVQGVVRRLGCHLRSRGHAVTHAWAFPVPPGSGDLPLPFRPLVMRGRLPAPRSTLWAAAALLRLASALRRLGPDVVNVHYVTAEAGYFALLKPVFGYRLVLSFHGSDILRTQAVDAPMLPRLLPRADAVTAVSRAAAARLLEAYAVPPARLHVVPNGVDVDFWSTESGTGRRDRDPVVLAVGRLDPVKGHDVLLRAFPRVRARVPAARLVIVGGGGDRAPLEALAADLGIAAAVTFDGPLDAARVRERLAGARVFVLPSRSEGLPLSLVEAMAAGVPCVATAVGGTPEVLTPDAGVLVPAEDPASLGDAVADLLLDEARSSSLAVAGRRRAAELSATTSTAAYEEVLLGRVDRRQTPAGSGTEPVHSGP